MKRVPRVPAFTVKVRCPGWADGRFVVQVSGGFFSFRLAVGDQPGGCALVGVYLARERGGRSFDVQVDGTTIFTDNLTDMGRPGFVFREMPIPSELLAGKKTVEVKFVPKPGNIAGGIFGLRMVSVAPEA